MSKCVSYMLQWYVWKHGTPAKVLQKSSFSYLKATATNRMHSSALKHEGRSIVIFSSFPKSIFWGVSDAVLVFVILTLFRMTAQYMFTQDFLSLVKKNPTFYISRLKMKTAIFLKISCRHEWYPIFIHYLIL